MKLLFLVAALLSSTAIFATESSVTVPWSEFDTIYKEQLTQSLTTEEVEPEPVITLEDIQYDLKVQGELVSGSITIRGNVLVGDPEPLHLFGQNIAVIEVIEAQNAVLLAHDGNYALYTFDAGVFSIRFAVSIPISDFQVRPRLEFDVPPAVRNELKIKTSEHLKILPSDSLHAVDDRYFFSPRRLLKISFEHLSQPLNGRESEDSLLAEVEIPEAVLHAVTFFTSFAEDGTVLSAMSLVLPPNDTNQLVLDPIDGAEVWSLQVNDKPRSLFLSAAEKWVIPLDPKVESRVVLAYLTRNQKLGLEGRLDFKIPETGLTARAINLVVGLPERMHMLAMDSDFPTRQRAGLAEIQ